ncbi:pimeloyl-ACP methyl ester carboxylesterase [Pseudonocardia hierapolitana]|uniref:Pimeloyl-ACP methyl ester carboxylesterase n=1 Tax=Pseudonocardia hierapolitana TaxID=1128676 RepID=A0A561T450_9PSEU|nr:alpha/beta hydrolase [Pseudonocardia hierapolitana]TWF81891.1 pimeloyl-ACP methyl ester carboxylesterase [Pseudonocardia hierapolitana]
MNTHYARNGTVRIAYSDLGGAGGDPLLLVMGLGVSRAWWPQGFVFALVEQGFHVVAYDQRDSGESTRFPDEDHVHPFTALFRGRSAPYSAEDMTDDAVAVLDAVGWSSAHVFGHSLGGLLAQRIALRHPGRVRSITVSGAMPSDAAGLSQLRHVRLGFVLRMSRLKFPEGPEGDVAAGLALARAIASPGYPFDEAEVRAAVEREVTSGIRDVRAQSRQTGAPWHGGRLAELTVPALVLHGEQDPVVRPSAARATAAAVPDARLVQLPGVGHDLPRALWPRIAGDVRALADRVAS